MLEGVLTKFSTVIVPDGLVNVMAEEGKVIEYVLLPSPVTVNEAAETVPVTTGRVTPPVLVRAPEVGRTTVPPNVGLTAMLPKFISTSFSMAIGVMMVAVVEAVAVTCAKEVAVNPRTMIARASKFFIGVEFFE